MRSIYIKSLTELLLAAQKEDQESMEILYLKFTPLLLKEASRNGQIDWDCYQELAEHFIKLILAFKLTE